MTRAWTRGSCMGVVAVAVALLASPVSAARADDRVVFRIGSSEIDESSSLVVSTTHPHLVYTSNDSGDAAIVYVLDSRTGDLVGTTSLVGVDPLDVEALAGGDDGSLVMADIGDNDSDRSSVTVYRFPQPGPGTSSVEADAVTLSYDGGPRDAEGVLYDAASGRVFVVSKEYVDGHVYGSPPHVFDRDHAELQPVARAPDIATDATFLPAGDVVAIRTYLAVVFYRYPGWSELATMRVPIQPQGESVAAPPGGRELWIGSEGVGATVLAVDVPDLTPPATPTISPSTPPPAASDPGDEEREVLKGRAVIVGVIAVGLLAVVVAVIVIRYIRHHPDHH
jgi:hypothetical protein